jgi:hypothetical protein
VCSCLLTAALFRQGCWSVVYGSSGQLGKVLWTCLFHCGDLLFTAVCGCSKSFSFCKSVFAAVRVQRLALVTPLLLWADVVYRT